MFTNLAIGDEVSNGTAQRGLFRKGVIGRKAGAGCARCRTGCPRSLPAFETDLIRLSSPCARASPGPTMPTSAQTAWHFAASPLFIVFSFESETALGCSFLSKAQTRVK